MGGGIVFRIQLTMEGEGGAEAADRVTVQRIGIGAQIVAFEHLFEITAVGREVLGKEGCYAL